MQEINKLTGYIVVGILHLCKSEIIVLCMHISHHAMPVSRVSVTEWKKLNFGKYKEFILAAQQDWNLTKPNVFSSVLGNKTPDKNKNLIWWLASFNTKSGLWYYI